MPYCSRDSRYFVYQRNNRKLKDNRTEFMVVELGTWKQHLLDTSIGLAGSAITHNGAFYYLKKTAEGPMKRVLGYEPAPLVSTDFNHTDESSIFAPEQTRVVEDRMVRVLAWYDNEWGFSVRMADVAVAMGKLG